MSVRRFCLPIFLSPQFITTRSVLPDYDFSLCQYICVFDVILDSYSVQSLLTPDLVTSLTHLLLFNKVNDSTPPLYMNK